MKFSRLTSFSVLALVALCLVPSCKNREGSDLLSDKNGNGTLLSCPGNGVEGVNTLSKHLFVTDLWMAKSHEDIKGIAPIKRPDGSVDETLSFAEIADRMLERIKYVDYFSYQDMKVLLKVANPELGNNTARASDDFDVSHVNPTLGALDLPKDQGKSIDGQEQKCVPVFAAINGDSVVNKYKFNYVLKYWAQLDNMNKAALMLHEVTDYYYRTKTKHDLVGEQLTFFVAKIFGDTVPKELNKTAADYVKLVNEDRYDGAATFAFKPEQIFYTKDISASPFRLIDGFAVVSSGLSHWGFREDGTLHEATIAYRNQENFILRATDSNGLLRTLKLEGFYDTTPPSLVFDNAGKVIEIKARLSGGDEGEKEQMKRLGLDPAKYGYIHIVWDADRSAYALKETE